MLQTDGPRHSDELATVKSCVHCQLPAEVLNGRFEYMEQEKFQKDYVQTVPGGHKLISLNIEESVVKVWVAPRPLWPLLLVSSILLA